VKLIWVTILLRIWYNIACGGAWYKT